MPVQQGRSHLDSGVYEGIREHNQGAKAPLAAIFNTPLFNDDHG
jgi:hypothetical protein